jgi:hypothetical protein
MNTKIPRSFAVMITFSVCMMVFLGIAITQPSSATTSVAQSGENATATPAEPSTLDDMLGGIVGPDPDMATYTVTLGLWRNLRPTESYLHGVSMLDPEQYPVDCVSDGRESKGWIVGDAGVILGYCNGVWDHAIMVESIPTNLYGVQAISQTLSVAVGQGGAILLYLYDPIALDWVWTKSYIPVGNQALYYVSMVPDVNDTFTGWVVGTADSNGLGTLVRGRIEKGALVNGNQTYDYSWENVTSSFPNLPKVDSYYSVHILSPNNGWAVGGKEGVRGVIIHWDGVSWQEQKVIDGGSFYSVHMNSSQDGWAVGDKGVIYHFNGSSWLSVNSPVTKVLAAIDFAPNGEGWIVGYDGTLLKYVGGEWKLFTDLRTDHFDLRAVDFTSGHGWAVGLQFSTSMGGTILEYEDGLWLAVTPPTDNRLMEVSVLNDNNAWAVGTADSAGGTIIHWDGKHWQRWYQQDLPLPAVDLYTIDMVSAVDGWAAGAPTVSGGPAIMLHWDGFRWSPYRYDAPINAVPINDLDMWNSGFGWAVADNGNAVAKYFDNDPNDDEPGFWSANHTCQGAYYQLRGTTIITDAGSIFGWDAWAVGTSWPGNYPRLPEFFLRYVSGCAGGYAWDVDDSPGACPLPTAVPHPPDPTPTPLPTPSDGPTSSTLYGIQMLPNPWGYAVGQYYDRATIYEYDEASGWHLYFCQPDKVYTPSRFYSVDIVKGSNVAWIGGYQWEYALNRKYAYISYIDSSGRRWARDPIPWNGRNIYHRPIKSISMSSDTMGWAVGDPEQDPYISSRKLSVIYQYPYPNFTLNGSPAGRAVLPGGSTFFTATVNTLGGFNSNVFLTIPSGIPPLTSYTVTPDYIDTDLMATVSVATNASTPLGVYYIDLHGHAQYYSGDNQLTVERDAYLRLTVTRNPIYSVNPTHGPAGTLVTITGEGFGSSMGGSDFIVLAGKQMPASAIVSWSNTQIVVRVPDDIVLFPRGPVEGNVYVQAGGSTSNTDLYFQLENSLSDIDLQLMGDQIRITLTGTSLGKDPGSLFRSTNYEHIALNGAWIPNSSVVSWSNNTIVFDVPVGTLPGEVAVTSNGFESNALLFNPLSYKVFLPLTGR